MGKCFNPRRIKTSSLTFWERFPLGTPLLPAARSESYRGCSWHPSRHELVNSLQRVINWETVGKSTETLQRKTEHKRGVSS